MEPFARIRKTRICGLVRVNVSLGWTLTFQKHITGTMILSLFASHKIAVNYFSIIMIARTSMFAAMLLSCS